jgi:uncharacterized radical SAM protein YgiQ
VDHTAQLALLKALRRLPGVRHVFVASGLRCDLVMADRRAGGTFIDTLAGRHVSGQLKIAPEHSEPDILTRMGKPGIAYLAPFRNRFMKASRAAGKRQYLTYYFIAAHPGTRLDHMQCLKHYARQALKLSPEQVQIFTPTPSTWSSLMYWTGRDPFRHDKLFVEKDPARKQRQKEILLPRHGIRKTVSRPRPRRPSPTARRGPRRR